LSACAVLAARPHPDALCASTLPTLRVRRDEKKEERMRLADKVALVTGAGSGFGKGIAETFAREGAKVAVVDINEAAAKAVTAGIGGAARAIRADVARKADVEAAVAATIAAFGRVDILVNNAGTTH